MEPIILASTSPRRQEILRSLNIPFSVMAPIYEEPKAVSGNPTEITELNSMKKVESIIRMDLNLSVPWVLGADTLIVQNGSLFGKPSDRKEAQAMIKSLSGKTHSVVTSISLFASKTNFITSKTCETTVSFMKLDDEEIEDYLDTSEWQGVAGGYRIQGRAACFIDRIEGSWSGIVGLPIHALYVILREARIPIFGITGIFSGADLGTETQRRGSFICNRYTAKEKLMAVVTMKSLLESGVHFGHQVKRWDPRMKKFIFAERNGIHIIDLQKTILSIKEAYEAVRKTVISGKGVLFVGTKKQAQQTIAKEAERCGMFYINNRWLGGMLTNFTTIKKSLLRLKKIEKMQSDGTFESLTKKEIASLEKEMAKLEKNLGGIKEMKELPGIIFVIDTRKETIGVAEARRMGIPIVAVVDTNCNPEGIDYPIPGNDDAIRAISLFTQIIANAVIEADNENGLKIIENLQDEDEEDFETKDEEDDTASSEEVIEDYKNYTPKEKAIEPQETESDATETLLDEEKIYEDK